VTRKRINYFRSNKVTWKQGFVKFQRVRWHSCMQWGWPKINAGEAPIEWSDYFVLSFKVGTHGVVWHYNPKPPSWFWKEHQPHIPWYITKRASWWNTTCLLVSTTFRRKR